MLLNQLLTNQIGYVNNDNKLGYSDMRRICRNLRTSIFDNSKCSIWNGYITNNKNGKQYINFYFKKKKIALHRLLYMNFVGNLDKSEYLKQTCENLGKCCTISHIKIANSENKKPKSPPKNNKNNKNKGKGLIIVNKINIKI